MDVLTTIFYFLVTISILVFVHELGHFLAAKLCGMRVERFSIGFPPRLISKKIGETEYTFALIPLGGYVKISGMVDESFDTEFKDREPQPWEYRSKPIWQRMFVISAGVIMNTLLAVIIFWGINFTQGKYVEDTTEVGFVRSNSPAAVAGFMPEDKIIRINERSIGNWGDVMRVINAETIGQNLTILVERDGREHTLTLPANENISSPQTHFGLIQKYTEAIVMEVIPETPAEDLGLQAGDVFVSIDERFVSNEAEVIEIVSGKPGVEIPVVWKRDGDIMSGIVTPNEEGRIGISIGRQYTGPVEHIKYGFFGAIPAGITDMFEMLRLLLRSLWFMVTGTLSFSENVGGPIMIAQIASHSAEAGFGSFITFLGLLSITLAFINILPFPVLDGGHLMYLVYEIIFRKEVPAKVQIALQHAGFIILLAVMAFVIYNDIARL
jgi:regulator of sigma E protease